MNAPVAVAPDRRKERIEYAKTCADRFIEVCKARLAVGTTLAVAVVTLTGFGLHTKRHELLVVAATLPLVLLIVVDILTKSRYAAPFLFIGLLIEDELFGDESAGMLFMRLNSRNKNKYLQALRNPDRQAGYNAFRREYSRSGLGTKIPIFLLVSVSELALAYLVR